MGLKGRLPTFIDNFLTDRHFKVKVNSTMSDPFEQEMGVPQVYSLAKTLQNNVEGSLYVDDFLFVIEPKI